MAHTATSQGYEARIVFLRERLLPLDIAHVVCEVFYDGGWHLFDPDRGRYYFDGDTVADYKYLSKNPPNDSCLSGRLNGWITVSRRHLEIEVGGSRSQGLVFGRSRWRAGSTLAGHDALGRAVPLLSRHESIGGEGGLAANRLCLKLADDSYAWKVRISE